MLPGRSLAGSGAEAEEYASAATIISFQKDATYSSASVAENAPPASRTKARKSREASLSGNILRVEGFDSAAHCIRRFGELALDLVDD